MLVGWLFSDCFEVILSNLYFLSVVDPKSLLNVWKQKKNPTSLSLPRGSVWVRAHGPAHAFHSPNSIWAFTAASIEHLSSSRWKPGAFLGPPWAYAWPTHPHDLLILVPFWIPRNVSDLSKAPVFLPKLFGLLCCLIQLLVCFFLRRWIRHY